MAKASKSFLRAYVAEMFAAFGGGVDERLVDIGERISGVEACHGKWHDAWRGFPAPSELWARLAAVESSVGTVGELHRRLQTAEALIAKFSGRDELSARERAAKDFHVKAESWAAKLEEARQERDHWKSRAAVLSDSVREARRLPSCSSEVKQELDAALNVAGTARGA
jgi:hypothetical protein